MKTISLLVLISLVSISRSYGESKQWFTNAPEDLSVDTVANDVWHWYNMNGLEPLAIQRVEWNSKPLFGKGRWGYFIFYKCRLKDHVAAQAIKTASKDFEGYSGLPKWAEHAPKWWTPERILPADLANTIVDQPTLIFMAQDSDDIFIYCIKRPIDDAPL